jgi:hypothetical protein
MIYLNLHWPAQSRLNANSPDNSAHRTSAQDRANTILAFAVCLPFLHELVMDADEFEDLAEPFLSHLELSSQPSLVKPFASLRRVHFNGIHKPRPLVLYERLMAALPQLRQLSGPFGQFGQLTCR